MRLAGWLGLILAIVVSLVFGLGTYSEWIKIVARDGSFDPWQERVWIARMASVQLTCMLAATISWGLVRLRSWSRYLLTRVTILPIPAVIVCYVLGVLLGRPRILELPWAFILAIVMTLPFSITILYLLWSPRKAFEPGQTLTWGRVGCLPILAALAFVFAEGVAYVVFVLSAMGILDIFGVFNG